MKRLLLACDWRGLALSDLLAHLWVSHGWKWGGKR